MAAVVLSVPGSPNVGGTIALNASAIDNVGVTKVEFYRDGALFTTLIAAPFSTSFDTRTLANGSHTFLAKAYDAAGNNNSSSATVLVDNAAPTVSLTAPASGSTVSSTVTLSATASDNSGGSGVAKVEFYCDNLTTPLGTTTVAPYSAPCDTTTLPNGGHNFYCKAYDAAGNSANSSSITVTVNNTTVSGGQLQWVRDIIGTGDVKTRAVAVDHANNVVVAGFFGTGADFGGGLKASHGMADMFIAKYTAQNSLVWAKALGEGADDTAYAVAVDSQDNVIVTGLFYGSMDFGGVTLTSSGGPDIFVAKYSAAGALAWAKRFGGGANDTGCSVAVDRSDNVILTASFTGPVDFGAGILGSATFYNMAVVKLSPAGATIWAKGWGGSNPVFPYAATVDRSGDVEITGRLYGPTDLGGGLSSGGGIFVTKYSGVDGSYRWGKVLGGTAGNGIATDTNTGNIFVTGEFSGSVNLGGGSLSTLDNGGIFLAAYDPSGNWLWNKAYGASGDSGMAVSVDRNGNLALTGRANSGLDLAGTGAYNPGNGYFIASFGSSGNSAPACRWSKRSSGTGFSIGSGVAFDSLGHIVTGGSFYLTADFGGISVTPPYGNYDGFVAQYMQ